MERSEGIEPVVCGLEGRGSTIELAPRAITTIAILLLSACSPPPPIVSADTSCERFRHISATDAQIKVFSDNWEVMESYADQIVSHNVEFDKRCM